MKIPVWKASTTRSHAAKVTRVAQQQRNKKPYGRALVDRLLWHAWMLLLTFVFVIGPELVAALWSIWRFLQRSS